MADELLKDIANDIGLEFTGGSQEIAPPVTSIDALGNLSILWEYDNIQVQVNDIERSRRELSCYLSIREGDAGGRTRWICAPVRINLLSDSAKNGLRRNLNERKPLDWASRLDQVVVAVYKAAEAQRKPGILTSRAKTTEQDWLLSPILERNQHSMLVASGGTGKSLLSLALCASIVTGKTIIPGIEPGEFDKNCLYLDWETDQETHERRLTQICEGVGVLFPDGRIHYIRMSVPLSQDVAYIHEYIIKHRIGLVVNDSVGMATGGDMNSQADAIAYVGAARAIGDVTVMSIHHVGWGDTQRNTGSRYFENAARSVWVLEKQQDADTAESHLDLTHRKANNGLLRAPIGIRTEFGDVIRYYSDTVSAEKQSTPERIREVLSVGRLSLQAIYEDLEDIPKATIRKALERMTHSGEVTKYDGSNRKNPEYGLSVTSEIRHRDVTDRSSVTGDTPLGGVTPDVTEGTPENQDSNQNQRWLDDDEGSFG